MDAIAEWLTEADSECHAYSKPVFDAESDRDSIFDTFSFKDWLTEADIECHAYSKSIVDTIHDTDADW